MTELAPPRTQEQRFRARLDGVLRLQQQVTALQVRLREELAALWLEDTSFGYMRFTADEIALACGVSRVTAQHWLDAATRFVKHPAVGARLALPLDEGGWSLAHADALLDAIDEVELTTEQVQQVIDQVSNHPDVLTPHQVRQAAQAAIVLLDPEAAAARYAKAKEGRKVGTFTTRRGSSLFLDGTTSDIARMMTSIDTLAGAKQPGDVRTLSQRRFDAVMDLLCGRTTAAPTQALVVVALSTLLGGDEPAEIPGHGLISAAEARDLLDGAELRRAVVDDHGQLVSVDTVTLTPDLLPASQAPRQQPLSPLLSVDIEPPPVDAVADTLDDLEPHDLAWHDDQLSRTDEVTRVRDRWRRDPDNRSHVETSLRRRLSAVRPHRPTHEARRRSARVTVELNTAGFHHHGPRPDPARRRRPPGPRPAPPGGRSWPPRTRPQKGPHDPPTPGELDWYETTRDRDAEDARDGCRTLRWRPEPADTPAGRAVPPTPTPDRRLWSVQGLYAALVRLLTRPVDTRPLDSTAYALPPRLARHIKTRDVTCSFPGCPRLARDCQNDHVIPWPQGTSTAGNLRSCCVHHHQSKTEGCFTVLALPDGSSTWTSTQTGRSSTRGARPLLRGF